MTVAAEPDRASPPELPAPAEAIGLPSPPGPRARPAFPLVACVAPLVAAGLIWWITGSALVLVFAVLSPVIAVASLVDGRRSNSRQRRRDSADYATAIAAAGEAVSLRLARLQRDAWRTAPSVHRMLGTPDDPARWADPATVSVVFGAGPVPSGLRLDGGGASPEQLELRRRAGTLAAAPITADPVGGIGLVGPGLLVRALARSLVVQLVGQLSPVSLGVRLPAGEDWAWAERLPHRVATTPARWLTVVQGASAPVGDLWIALAESGASLPPGCGTIVRVHGVSEAEIVRMPGRPTGLRFAPQLVAERQTDGFGDLLSHEAGIAGLTGAGPALPDMVEFGALASMAPEVPTGEPGGPDRPAVSLDCVIGLGEQGPFHVDLVGEGPHALVGGTTGSGKSELLVTWVAAMAARYPPSQVTFLLVDFKGGAAFDAVRELPHCVGLITDLDEHEALRALASLAAELRHRERVLRDTGSRDITDPRSAGRLARLVIVVDEFATMLSAFPALHALFVDIAARGRSLGVHLVLCTQRPAGVVRDALLANCSLRLSLRVNNQADSQAVIGSDAAALIGADRPGRCAVRRGAALPQSCQVATTSAADIRGISAARAGRAAPPRRPWLDPLPAVVTADSPALLAAAPHRQRDGFVLGLLDEPELQRQNPAWYDPGQDGHLLVVGGARTGKSTLLAALAAQHPRQVELIPADVEASWDALVRARAQLDGVALPLPAGRHRQNRGPECTVLLFDDIDAVLGRWSEEHRAAATELLIGLLRDGGQNGLRLVVTAQRLTGQLQTLPALCQNRLVLRLPSVHEHQAAGEPAPSFDPALPPGGGRWRGERIQLVHAEAHRDTVPPPAPSVLGSAAAARLLLVVAGSAARSAAAFRAAGSAFPRVIELAAQPIPGAAGQLAVTEGAERTVLVGDADTWQAHWSLLTGLRAVAPLVFDGVGLADFRVLARRRELPPPVAPGRSHGWMLSPDGTVRRVTLP